MYKLEEKLRKENNEYEKQLNKENNKILTDMIVYLHSANLCEYDVEIIRKELIGMAVEAQLRGEGLSKVIGENYKAFCDELIKNGRQKTTYEKVLENLHVLILGVGILFLFQIVLHITGAVFKSRSGNAVLNMPITLGFLLSSAMSVIFAYVIFYFVTKNSFEINKNKKYNILFVVICMFAFGVSIAAGIVFDKIIVCSINFIYIILAFAILYIMLDILSNKYSENVARTHK